MTSNRPLLGGVPFSLSNWMYGNCSTLKKSPFLRCLLRLASLVSSVATSIHAVGRASSGLIHGDYKPSNLLVNPHTHTVSGVLDWEFAFAGPPLYDLATLLRDSESYPAE